MGYIAASTHALGTATGTAHVVVDVLPEVGGIGRQALAISLI